MNVSDVLDAAIEAPIAPSFTRIGYEARRRLDDWAPVDSYDLTGRVIVVTGATSGLGLAAAEQLARNGAQVVVVGRRAERNESVLESIQDRVPGAQLSAVAADMAERDQVHALADAVLADHDRLDVLVHNAGALSAERTTNSDGIESTVASQVVGPFLLTALLLDRLTATGDARVLTMSSGGMYSAPLTVAELEMTPESYAGAQQYARAKRAQVTLNELWAERGAVTGVRFHALHPGWADTPGVDDALPLFSKVVGPLLRTPAQGADTLVWLAADDEALQSNGGFWHDRRTRSLHRLPTTRRTDTVERRNRLWSWVAERAGVDPSFTPAPDPEDAT